MVFFKAWRKAFCSVVFRHAGKGSLPTRKTNHEAKLFAQVVFRDAGELSLLT